MELWEIKVCLTLVQTVQNFGCSRGSINCPAPNHPGRSGLTLSIWYLYCHRQPKPLPPLHSSPSFLPGTCHLPNCPSAAAAIWLLSAVSKLRDVQGQGRVQPEREGGQSSQRQLILQAGTFMGRQAALGRIKMCFNLY